MSTPFSLENTCLLTTGIWQRWKPLTEMSWGVTAQLWVAGPKDKTFLNPKICSKFGTAFELIDYPLLFEGLGWGKKEGRRDRGRKKGKKKASKLQQAIVKGYLWWQSWWEIYECWWAQDLCHSLNFSLRQLQLKLEFYTCFAFFPSPQQPLESLLYWNLMLKVSTLPCW